MAEWMKCDEWMPEDGQRVLAYLGESVGIVTFYASRYGSYYADDESYEMTPTHWMPMPEPPEGAR